MNEFKTYHPIVNFVYFMFVTGFSMFFMHPVCLGISLFSAFAYSAYLKGSKAIKSTLGYMLPMMLLMAIINPLFNHEGATIIQYLPSGNPLTLESIAYGLAAAVMLVSVICWFSCYNAVMTSDKFIYLFARLIPSLSLIFSMTLRFVPKFSAQLKTVANARRCIGYGVSGRGITQKIKSALSVLSTMITWALENAVDTADSMKSRGYGLSGRTSFSIFTFDKRDKIALLAIAFAGVYVLIGAILGAMHFSYFPMLKTNDVSFYEMSIFIVYAALCVVPMIIEAVEVRKWKAIKSDI